jgi:DNA (cytosine-5)-methyltransferase 1
LCNSFLFEGFAGYGGASFGLKRSGLNYKVIGMSEFNPFASKLLEANFPDIKNWGDITKIDPKELPNFDMFTGGFPCQPFSSAGMQMGEDDIGQEHTKAYQTKVLTIRNLFDYYE